MTDRDSLIELIVNADTYDSYECKLCTKKDASCTRCKAEKLADHLLANGVIVPPCKVGDKVYYIAGKKVYKSKCHAITQHKSGLQIHLYDYDGDNARYSTKDVFLTKEEAEQKLKELGK